MRCFAIFAVLFCFAHAQDADPKQSLAKKFVELKIELATATAGAREALSGTGDPAQQAKARMEYFRQTGVFCQKAMQLVNDYPNDPDTLAVLNWILAGPFGYTEEAGLSIDAAYDRLISKFSDDERILPLCENARRFALGSTKSIALLRAVVKRNPSQRVRGLVSLRLGDLLVEYANFAATFKDAEANGRDVPDFQRISTPMRREFLNSDSARLKSEAIAVFEQAVRSWTNVKASPEQTVGEIAEGRLFGLRELTPGKPAPALNGFDLELKEVKLSGYRGKVVVLVFWAGWWAPSTAVAAPIRDLLKHFEGKPIAVLGVNADANRETADRVAKQEQITWPSVFDGSTGHGPIATKWGIVIWPTIYVIDVDGVIRHVTHDATRLEPIIAELLKVKK
jgi:peroxiredoxin